MPGPMPLMNRGGGGVPPRAPGGAGGGMGMRRDVTEKGEKPIYFSQLNFDETANDYMMTKVTFGTLAALIVITVIAVLFNFGINVFVGIAIAFAFWAVYCIQSLVMYSKMSKLPYKDKKNYWTYERTPEYKQRNVVLNDFKRKIATELLGNDRTVLVDDVSVELTSFDPLVFDFFIRGGKAEDQIKRQVPSWGSKFECKEGTITSTGNCSWKVIYPRKDKWKTLNGKKVTPADVIGEKHDPSPDCVPIGVRTDNFEEICVNQVEYHTMVSGTSGMGKSNMFNMLMSTQFPFDSIILFFDGAGSEWVIGRDRWFSIPYDQEETGNVLAKAWMRAIIEEISKSGPRNAKMEETGMSKFLTAAKAQDDEDAIPLSRDFPPIIIAVDECRTWTDGSDATRASFSREFINMMNLVASKGRKYAVTIMVASQQPKNTQIPDGVSSQVGQFIAFQQPKSLEQFAFGNNEIDISAAAPSDIPAGADGVGQFAFCGNGCENKAIPVKGYFASREDIKQKAREFSYKKRLNNPIVQRAIRHYKEERQKELAKRPNLNIPEQMPL